MAGTPRRALLIGGLTGSLATLAGCRIPGGDATGAGRASVHPLQATLAGTLALAGRYDATTAAQPALAGRLAPLRAEHWAHVSALSAAMGRPAPSAAPSASTSTPPVPDARTAVAALRALERSAQADAASACLAAAAAYAELLGSIAACRATHVEVLT